MFTRMSKVILYIVEAVLLIGSLVGGCALGAEEGDAGAGLIYILIFLLVSFLILVSFGLFVELANNVLDIKRMMEGKNKKYAGSVSAQESSQGNIAPEMNRKHTEPVMEPDNREYETVKERISLDDLARMAAQADAEEGEQQGWFCSECGIRNTADTVACIACGKEKYNN